MKTLKAIKCSLVIMVALVATPSFAGSILFYDDFVFGGPDTWGTALSASGHTITSVSDDTAFATAIGSGSYDLAVVQFDNTSHSTAASALSSYVTGGGKAIFGHWLTEADAAFGVTQTGANLSTLTLSMFDTGLSSFVQVLTNPTYGIFSRSFTTVDTIGATFEDGNAGIVVGNSGRTIINGFLGNTIASSADEIQLYTNQISYLMGGSGSGEIPAPAPLALMGLGLAALGYSRKRKA